MILYYYYNTERSKLYMVYGREDDTMKKLNFWQRLMLRNLWGLVENEGNIYYRKLYHKNIEQLVWNKKE